MLFNRQAECTSLSGPPSPLSRNPLPHSASTWSFFQYRRSHCNNSTFPSDPTLWVRDYSPAARLSASPSCTPQKMPNSPPRCPTAHPLRCSPPPVFATLACRPRGTAEPESGGIISLTFHADNAYVSVLSVTGRVDVN